jgi:hypothetical protein
MTKSTTPGEAAGALNAPLGDVLARVAHELNHLTARLQHVETMVGPLVVGVAPFDANLVHRIQDLDHIRQKVEGISDFLAALAPVVPNHYRVNARAAARLVTLPDVAARLALSEVGGADLGECGLF